MAAALFVIAAPPASAQGFAGLGEGAEDFAPVTPGVPLSFPEDYGAHPGHRIEWWYVTANLADAEGTRYGVQWTLFRQALTPGPQRAGWASQQMFMGHAAVTSASTHVFAETLGRGGIGQAGVEAAPFRAWIDDWSLASEGGEGLSDLAMTAAGDGFSYQLHLTTDLAPVPQGEEGYSRKSDDGQASYYFSQPFLAAEGIIRLGGEEIAVTGRAWMDREWSSQPLAADQEGWDWFSLHLDSGEKLMLFQLRGRDGSAFTSGTWIEPDGGTTPLAAEDVIIEPGAAIETDGSMLPESWRLAVPARDLDVTVTPLNPSSFVGTTVPYWEGPVIITGSMGGVGYLEMTGR
jgi:predicted secreted hydrolase